jgi:hypothetical protein
MQVKDRLQALFEIDIMINIMMKSQNLKYIMNDFFVTVNVIYNTGGLESQETCPLSMLGSVNMVVDYLHQHIYQSTPLYVKKPVSPQD